MKKKNTSNFKLLIAIIGLILFITTVYEIVLIKIESTKPGYPYGQEVAEEEPEESEEEEEKTEESEKPEAEEKEPEEEEIAEKPEKEKEYEKPSYNFKTEEVTVEIRDLTKEYTLAWVSDVHIIADKAVAEDVLKEDLETIKQRYETLSVTSEGVHGDELWPEIVKFLNYGHYDGIIFGGDILDYFSRANMDVFMEGYRQLNPDVPVLYIRADHDYGAYYGGEAMTEEISHKVHTEVDGDDLEQKYLNFNDEFMVIGVNNSTKNLVSEQMRVIRELSETGVPVILATHVPFPSQIEDQKADMEALSMQVRNKIYYWGGPDYQPNEVTQELLDKIYWEHTPIKQVLAGHLHAPWDGMLTEKVPEHIFSPAYSGTIGIVHVVPKE